MERQSEVEERAWKTSNAQIKCLRLELLPVTVRVPTMLCFTAVTLPRHHTSEVNVMNTVPWTR